MVVHQLTGISVRTSILFRIFHLLVRRDCHIPMVRLGSQYGGWWIPEAGMVRECVAYLAGVGEDISFDVALMRRFGCRVVGIDPTPRAADWVSKHAPPGYHFVQKGLAGRSGVATFYAPADVNHVSHSMVFDRKAGSFVAEVLTLHELMKSLNDVEVDLLKLDIEGAQHEVIESMLRDGIRPRVICVEFDQPEPVSRSRATVHRLRSAGYRVAKVEGFNVTLVLPARID